MNSELLLLFPTPVYISNIGVDFGVSIDREFDTVLGGFISKKQNYLLENKKLGKEIDLHIENYMRNNLHLNKEVKLKHQCSWILIHNKGGHSPKHYHNNSWLSGIYYLDVNEESGDLEFQDSPPYSWTCGNMDPTDQIEEFNMVNATRMTFRPKPGDVYLFPSHLNHLSHFNKSDKQRVCISFNYTLCGKWGQTTGYVRT